MVPTLCAEQRVEENILLKHLQELEPCNIE